MWRYYKLHMIGKMTSANIKKACESAGFITPCGKCASCGNEDQTNCIPTQNSNYMEAMAELSQKLCNEAFARDCPSLNEVFVHFKEGTMDGLSGDKTKKDYWINGKDNDNKYALCAKENRK